MGNNNSQDLARKKIVWIDQNVNSEENKSYLKLISEYTIYPEKTVKQGLEIIKKESEKSYTDRPFIIYVIISGRRAEEFFTEYGKIYNDLPIVCATIVFCMDKKLHSSKPYFNDPFLNPGKVVTTFDEVKEYINKDQTGWSNILNNSLPNNIEAEGNEYGFTFRLPEKQEDIFCPILLGKLINNSLIKKEDIKKFQSFIYGYKDPIMCKLVNPSQEKLIDIPYSILSKFFIALYTYENVKAFYRDMNRLLTKGKFDYYRTFIFLIYTNLNKKILNSFSNKDLYRGGQFTTKELNRIKKYLVENKNNKNKEFPIATLSSNNFLSFSKNKKKALEFMNNSNLKNGNTKVLFKVSEKEIKNDFFISNVIVGNNSYFPNEEEILFLPLSCFEVKSIKKKATYTIVNLSYLDSYQKAIEEKIKNTKTEELQDYLERVLSSSSTEEIIKLMGNNELRESFNDYISKQRECPFEMKKITINTGYIPKHNKPNFDPLAEAPMKGFSNGKQLNELFLKEPKYVRVFKSKFNGENNYFAIDLEYNDGTRAMIKQKNFNEEYIVIKKIDELGRQGYNDYSFQQIGEKIEVSRMNTQDFLSSLEKERQKNLVNPEIQNGKGFECSNGKCFKEQALFNNFYNEAFMMGGGIGNLIANIDIMSKSNAKTNAKRIGFSLGVPLLMSITTNISTRCLNDLCIAGISVGENIGTKVIPAIGIMVSGGILTYDITQTLTNHNKDNNEKAKSIVKKVVDIIGNAGLGIGCAQIGSQIGITLGIATGPGAIALGLIGGVIGGCIGGMLSRVLSDETFQMSSDTVYYKYIPSKFRQPNCPPHLKWKNVSKETKRFAIECLENITETKWLVLNIPQDVRSITPGNIPGNEVISFKGISDNCDEVDFIIYEIKTEEELTEDDWFGKDKSKLKNGGIFNSFILQLK